MEWQEKIEEARKFKGSGNDNYKAKQWKAAVGQYHRALLYIKGIEASQQPFFMDLQMREQPKVPEEILNEAKKLKIDCYNNLAACLLQQEQPNYEKIVTYCDDVLDVSPQNVKAMYRKGVSLYYLKNYESAKHVLAAASNLPDGQKDGNIRKYLQLCSKGLEIQEAKLKDTYKGMFQKMSEQTGDLTLS